LKWYKHISDSLDDPFVFELIDRFGGDGYLVFFGTLEIMSREFDVNSPGTCSISHRFLTKKLQLSRQKVRRILKFCDEKGRILINENESDITLNCPKLAKLCDEHTQRLLKETRESNGSESGVTPAQEVEEEVEVEIEKNKKPFVKTSIEFQLSKLLLDLILEHKPDFKKPDLQKWATCIDLMIRRDNRSSTTTRAVIEWCQQDAFWRSNVLSTSKLRKQFDQLEMKMEGENGRNTDNQTGKFPIIGKTKKSSEFSDGRPYPVDHVFTGEREEAKGES